MARSVVVGGEQYKIRNIVGVWLGLPLITLGIYHFVWWYKINNEARRYLRDVRISPGLSLLAILVGWLLIVPSVRLRLQDLHSNPADGAGGQGPIADRTGARAGAGLCVRVA
jgi:hypothetical protein